MSSTGILRIFPLYNDSDALLFPSNIFSFNEISFDEDAQTEDEIRDYLIAKGFFNLQDCLDDLKTNALSNIDSNEK